MILGGNATLYVSDFEAAVRFYTEDLGLPIRFRAGNHWAEVVAGKDLVIGLHPARPNGPKPGTAGAVQIGLVVEGPLEDVLARLAERGVAIDGPLIDDPGSGFRFANIRDLDGNPIYLWEKSKKRRAPARRRRPAASRR